MLPFNGNYEWGGVGGLLVRSEVLQYVAALSGYFFLKMCACTFVCVCAACVLCAQCVIVIMYVYII